MRSMQGRSAQATNRNAILGLWGLLSRSEAVWF